MKEIRSITKVTSSEFIGDKLDAYNNEEMLGIFDSEPGYFRQVIRPMLSPGHENELVYWLRDLGIIKNELMCKNARVDESCSKMMSWTSARVTDMYQWKCNGCLNKRSIREDSIFVNVKCSFKNAIRILLGWCKGNDIESMARLLGVKNSVIAGLYKKAAVVAKKYINSHIYEWQLGGPGTIVLIDTYPEGCTNSTLNRDGKPILTIMEVKSMPQKFWLEALENYRRNSVDHTKFVKENIFRTIKKIVVPGSVLVIPSDSSLCRCDDFQYLLDLYPTIVSTKELLRHNNDHQNLSFNLETIWKSVIEICDEAQYYNADNIQQFLFSRLWQNRYRDTAFEMLVYQLPL